MFRQHRRWSACAVSLAIGLSAGLYGQPAAANEGPTCTSLLEQFNAAIVSRSLPSAIGIENKIAVDPQCGGRLVEVQRQRAALELAKAQELISRGASTAEYEDLVVNADKPSVLWRAAVGLGDIRFSQRRFVDACIAYDRAIEIIKSKSKTPSAPDEALIKAVFNRAAESRMLAANEEGASSSFVAAAKDHRDGTVGGTMSQDIRGFKPTAVPIPIRFETASAQFTAIGQQAAQELLDAVRQQSPAQITLIGHTDERGASDYNMKLSEQRVRAVADFLKKNGVTAKISTFAKGKNEPLQLSGSSNLTKEDIWALNRRVVWQRN